MSWRRKPWLLVHDTRWVWHFASRRNCRIKYDQPQHDSTHHYVQRGSASTGEANAICIPSIHVSIYRLCFQVLNNSSWWSTMCVLVLHSYLHAVPQSSRPWLKGGDISVTVPHVLKFNRALSFLRVQYYSDFGSTLHLYLVSWAHRSTDQNWDYRCLRDFDDTELACH